MEELSEERSRELLAESAIGHLGVVRDGDPYVTPISYVLIGDEILFRTLPGSRLTAIASHPRVCLEVSHTDALGNWESAIVFGDAYVVDDANREADAVAALLDKYHSDEALLSFGPGRPFDPAPSVVAVPIGLITGRSSGGGFTPRTRPGRL